VRLDLRLERAQGREGGLAPGTLAHLAAARELRLGPRLALAKEEDGRD
jgi:hypothetical protein